MLWPLWRPAVVDRGVHVLRARAAMAGLAVVVIAMSATTLAVVVSAVPDSRADTREQRQLVDTLRGAGVRHLYSGYWTCNRISFDSGEKITCAVLDDKLGPGFDRYRPYRAAVAADSRPAYVFVADSPPDTLLRAHLRREGAPDTPVRTVGRYHVYLPNARVHPG
jgi:hypothetical protein